MSNGCMGMRKQWRIYLEDVARFAAKLAVLEAGPVEEVIEGVAVLWAENAVRTKHQRRGKARISPATTLPSVLGEEPKMTMAARCPSL